MTTTYFTTTVPTSATELMIQDAIIRRAWPHQETCALELSCPRSLAVIFLGGSQLANFLLDAAVTNLADLEGQKVLAYVHHNQVVGLSARF